MPAPSTGAITQQSLSGGPGRPYKGLRTAEATHTATMATANVAGLTKEVRTTKAITASDVAGLAKQARTTKAIAASNVAAVTKRVEPGAFAVVAINVAGLSTSLVGLIAPAMVASNTAALTKQARKPISVATANAVTTQKDVAITRQMVTSNTPGVVKQVETQKDIVANNVPGFAAGLLFVRSVAITTANAAILVTQFISGAPALPHPWYVKRRKLERIFDLIRRRQR